jgi:ParB family transcriptional regulator, chromosome partitioning protein
MKLALDRLRPDSNPVRHRPPPVDTSDLLQSMATVGQLVPILVVRLGAASDADPHYEVKEGNRRLEAAKALGWPALEAHVLELERAEDLLAAATAANLVRAPLAPVDTWRAMQALLGKGYDPPAAAGALGLSERQAARLDRLGQLHPDVLALIAAGTMPAEAQLRALANAPQELQHQALKAKGAITKVGKASIADWQRIAEACRRQRISRSVAQFDLEAAGVAFTRDVFAQPGDPDEWTTDDVAGFLEAQRAALKTQSESPASKGKLVMVTESNRDPGMPSLPTGWRQSHGDPNKPTKRETVYACVATRTGAIVRVTAVDAKAERDQERRQAERKAAKPKAPPAAEAPPAPAVAATSPAPAAAPGTLATLGATVGAAIGAAIGASSPAAAEPDDDPAEDPPDNARVAAEAAKAHLTKSGQQALADLKTIGLRARLRDTTRPIDAFDLVAMLVLALHAPNVRIDHYTAPAGWEAHKGRDLASQIVGPDGHLRYDDKQLLELAGETLARVLSFDRPSHTYSPYHARSGDTAEWIAAAAGVVPGEHLPRLDTAELLAGCEAPVLKEAAATAGIKYTTATAAKRELAGKLEHWRPAFAHFGAPGPRPPGAGS